MNKCIASILLVSVFLFQCQNNENEPNPYTAVDCSCKAPGYVYVNFQEGTTLKEALSYSETRSNGVASVSGWFLTKVSSDSAVIVNDYLKKFRDPDNGLYVTAYSDNSSGMAAINFDATIHTGKVTMNTAFNVWTEVIKDPMIKLEKYSVTILLKVNEGTEQEWIDTHNEDSIVKTLDLLRLRCACKSVG